MAKLLQDHKDVCPGCNQNDRLSFKVERRCSVIKNTNGVYQVTEETTVLVCLKCGHTIKYS